MDRLGSTDRTVDLRLYLGAGLFLAGTVVTAFGVAGTLGRLIGWRPAAAAGGLVVPLAGLSLLAVLPGSRRTRSAAVGGAAFATLGALLLYAVVPESWTGRVTAPLAIAGTVYAVGAGLAVASPLGAAFVALQPTRGADLGIELSRSRGDTRRATMPTDGGEDEDEDLSFPLERD